MITIEIDDREVLDTLNKVLGRINNLVPALREIGEDLTESTARRFATSTAPDGRTWAPNSDTTTLFYRLLAIWVGRRKILISFKV